ncbi:unnamed protein product [Mytilus coruscus]|uniref:Uncharacterized protein n=1 Tax=Mytilus coruscus TaxID=42192 RepID=A0A6J8DK67_MYTCO|nr:unnamed protein product [Mytilus coruscus]
MELYFEDDYRELFSRETKVCYIHDCNLIISRMVPDVESLSPKMTYAEVDVEHQNSSRTLLRGRDCLQLGQEDQIIKEYSIKRNEIVLDVTEDLAVILSSSVIHSFYQVPITEEPVEELRSSYDENDKHIAYGSVYIESYEVDCIIPSRTEFAESDEVECSIPTTIEFAESDELECSISTIEFAESDEVDCSIPTTIYFAESEEVESSSPTRIEFALTTVKVLASRSEVQVEQCTEDKFADIRLLALHVISHIHPGILCQWEECVYCCPNEQYKLEIHVLQHIYLEQFTFQSIEEWGRALPSGQFSENCTDLHLCPPHLKIKLGLPLLDEEFSMPSQYPYTVKDHQLYVLQLQTENPENYERLISAFQQKVETMSDTTASQSGTEPSTSTSDNTTELTIQGIDQLAVWNSNMTRSSQQVIVTNRPELTGTNQSTVKFTLRDETEIVTRKYISSKSKKRKYVASSIQNLNDRNMT